MIEYIIPITIGLIILILNLLLVGYFEKTYQILTFVLLSIISIINYGFYNFIIDYCNKQESYYVNGKQTYVSKIISFEIYTILQYIICTIIYIIYYFAK